MREQREVERTYAPDPESVLPDLTALPEVETVGEAEVAELSAAYFDTADLALLRGGVTLRRRTGGGDQGWHLKVPAGEGRDELHFPLDAGTIGPPDDLLRLVRAWTRGAQVALVATIDTRRSERPLLGPGGRVLAELADDQVSGKPADGGEPTEWREWELELVEAGPKLLVAADDLMEEAGFPASRVQRKILHVLGDRLPEEPPAPEAGVDEPACRVLAQRLAEQVGELLARDNQVRRGLPEGVHQARVACRRLRGALATFRPLVDRSVTDPIRDELKWLGQALADARDAVVVRRRLEDLIDEEPPGLVGGEARPRVAAAYEARGRAAVRQVQQALDSERYFALLAALDGLLADPPWTDAAAEPAVDVLPRRVRRDWKRVRNGVRDAPESDDRALHQVRKDAKRLRYAAETLAPVWGKDAERLAKAAKSLTQHLGERQDTVVSREHLVRLAAVAAGEGEASFTWGRLHAREQRHAEVLDEQWGDVWQRASRKKLRKWLG